MIVSSSSNNDKNCNTMKLLQEIFHNKLNCKIKLANRYTSITVFLFKIKGKRRPFGEVRRTLNFVPALSAFSPAHPPERSKQAYNIVNFDFLLAH